MIARFLVLVAVAACGDPAARLVLAPVALPGNCGKPARAGVTAIEWIAYHEGAETPQTLDPDAPAGVPLAGLPDDTEQLGIEIVSSSGVVAAGKTAPLQLGSLASGTTIPIVVLPMLGFCTTATAPMAARIAPLVAHAGNGVLIVGGTSPGGTQLETAEYYNPDTSEFEEVIVPIDLGTTGFLGASIAELADGTVLVTGPGHVNLQFDPKASPDARAFTSHTFGEMRALHATIAFDATHVLIAGGCEDAVAGMCSNPKQNVEDYPLADLDNVNAVVGTPERLGGATQDNARMFDLGMQPDGNRAFVLGGGTTSNSVAERIEWTLPQSTEISGMNAQLAPLVGGAILSAFASDGSPQTGAAGVLPPAGGALVPIANGPASDMQRLVALEDGTVLAVGGDPMGAISFYDPATNAWVPVTTSSGANAVAPPVVSAPILVRLLDGSVLVLGLSGTAPAAWLYRPTLLGASSGQGDTMSSAILVPSDPSTVTAPFVLNAPNSDDGNLIARALLGAPLTTNGTLTAKIQVSAGGVALLAQQVAPGRVLVGELVPGAPARIFRADNGTQTQICTGQTVLPFDGTSIEVSFAVSGQSATLSLAMTPMVTCSLGGDPDASDRGAWGIAADGTNSRVTIESASLQR